SAIHRSQIHRNHATLVTHIIRHSPHRLSHTNTHRRSRTTIEHNTGTREEWRAAHLALLEKGRRAQVDPVSRRQPGAGVAWGTETKLLEPEIQWKKRACCICPNSMS